MDRDFAFAMGILLATMVSVILGVIVLWLVADMLIRL